MRVQVLISNARKCETPIIGIGMHGESGYSIVHDHCEIADVDSTQMFYLSSLSWKA